jgi:acyl-CoA thioester hydrolase
MFKEDRFRYYLRVRYSECDAQKVVFNANYGDYVGIATMEFFRSLRVDHDMIDGNTIDYQVVKQTMEWRSPARFDDVLEVTVAVTHLGSTSFTTATGFRVAGEKRVIALAETVRVLLDPETMTKLTIPDHLRLALERGAPGVVVDHAGYLRT